MDSTQVHHNKETLPSTPEVTRRQSNMPSPIADLPAELLIIVLAYGAELDPLHLPMDGHPPSIAWVRFAHVCRFWRQVTLGERTHWARAIGILPRASATFLERAGDDTLLSFFVLRDESSVKKPECAALIDQLRAPVHSGRVESIEWHLDVPGRLHRAEGRLVNTILGDSTFGVLRHLRVTIRHYSWSWYNGEYDDANYDESKPLYFNSLETLHFNGYFMPIISPLLTTFSLRATGGWLSLENVLALLRCCPLLASVELKGIDGHYPPPKDSQTTVWLGHLNRLVLELDQPRREITKFIEHLSMPATVELHLRKVGSVEIEDYELIKAAFKITAVDDEPTALELDEGYVWLSVVPSLRIKFAINFLADRHLAEVLPTLNSGNCLHRVVQFTTCPSSWYINVDEWTRIFHLLPAVERLELKWPRAALCPPMSTIFAALGRGRPCTVPKLAAIVVGDDMWAETLSVENDVVVCLQARRAAGVRPLTSLDLMCFERSEEGARALETLVEGAVRWKDS